MCTSWSWCTSSLLLSLTGRAYLLIHCPPFQQALAAASAKRNAQTKAAATEETAQRFAAAETSMRSMLDRVETERSAVAQAVQELEAANQQVDSNMLVQLKKGGIPKQLALVGCVLFAGRSIADTIAAVGGNDESVLASALVQAVIAIACAIAFFVI